jgi:hypothetical protein
MYYLAGPYTHADQEVEGIRYEMLSLLSYNLLQNKELVFSPITHGHAMELEAKKLGLEPIPYTTWIAHGLQMLEMCNIMFVAQIPGYLESNGVQLEMITARSKNIPMQPISPETIVEVVGEDLYNRHNELLESELNVKVAK